MQKVIFSAVTALALAVVFTGSASAWRGGGDWGHDWNTEPETSSKLSVMNTDTYVKTNAMSGANTGANMQMGGDMQMMSTGDAGAEAYGLSNVNSTFLPDCGCYVSDNTELKIQNRNTHVDTNALSVANTGLNMQMAGQDENDHHRGRRSFHSAPSMPSVSMMETGNAGAYSESGSWVNMTDFSMSVGE